MTEMMEPLSVSKVNRLARQSLEHQGPLTIEGEISNMVRASSGHEYWTLKDAQAQLRCVLFKGRRQPEGVVLKDGLKVTLQGMLSLYEYRGDYQCIVSSVQEAGLGTLYRLFLVLKEKLNQLGLFDLARKKPIPEHIQKIGMITSPKGAALQDMLVTIQRRYPFVETILYPSDVQGVDAPLQLIRAIEKANEEKVCDVLILARGGGSLEDLNCFNDEQLAYAIAASALPIVTGIGHETDFTIADFVADHRAATPTAAASYVTPDWHLLRAQWQNLCVRFDRCMSVMLHKNVQHLDTLYARLDRAMKAYLEMKRYQLGLLVQSIETLSPLATLARGYAVAMQGTTVMTDHRQACVGETFLLHLKRGQLLCQVMRDMTDESEGLDR